MTKNFDFIFSFQFYIGYTCFRLITMFKILYQIVTAKYFTVSWPKCKTKQKTKKKSKVTKTHGSKYVTLATKVSSFYSASNLLNSIFFEISVLGIFEKSVALSWKPCVTIFSYWINQVYCIIRGRATFSFLFLFLSLNEQQNRGT